MREKIDDLRYELHNSNSEEELHEVFKEACNLSKLIPVNSDCNIEYKNLDALHLIIFESYKKFLELNKK